MKITRVAFNGWYKVSCHADVKSEIVSTSAAVRSACTIGCACTWMTCKFAHMITAPYRWPHPRPHRASDISAKFPARLRRIIREINVASPSDKAQRRGRWCSSHLFGIIANFSRYYILYFVKWHYDAGISVNRRMGDDGYNTGVKKIFANSKEDGNVWTLNCNRACFPSKVKFWKGDTYTMLIN